MIQGVEVKNLRKYEDEGGWLSELFRTDETILKPQMAYLSSVKPGVVRGPHEHLYQTDFFIFIGPGDFELHLWDNNKMSSTYGKKLVMQAGETNPISVKVPPRIVHAYKNLSDKPSIVINLPDKLYKGVNKKEAVDEIRYENNNNSQFRVS